MSKRTRTVAVMVSVLPIVLSAGLAESRASAAVFTSTPPEVVTENEAPLVWTFTSDAPGTMWGGVTWRLNTEAEWHMCGGPEASASLGPMPAGTYWVEIADEVDLGFAGLALRLPPFDRCSEPHVPALGPLHPVELSTVTVVPATVISPPATTTVTATGGSRSTASDACAVDRGRRHRLREAIHTDLRGLRTAATNARRASWRKRLTADRNALRATACR